MFSAQQAKKIDPRLNDLTDEELQAFIRDVFEMAQLSMECWSEEKKVPKSQ